MLEIGLLGTLQVVHRGVHVTPSAPKVRQVLALLALRANATVPLHQLVQELWEEHPPSSAATTLQTYIYQLRKLPGLSDQQSASRGAGHALVTTPGGYQLSVPHGCLDIQEFGELADRGRAAIEKGGMAEGADLLQRALSVWRGPALGDLTLGPVIGIDAIRLEERRYEVLEQRIDADLLLGRHHQLISELTALAADNLTREALHAKLMLSLHRAGRRPEALEVFQRLRAVLARELGLEPCSELQRLHQQVLAGDSRLDLPEGPVTVHPAPGGEPPVTLPADVPLSGRGTECDQVREALTEYGDSQGPMCVAVGGPPGAGSTAVAVAVAHRLGDVFTDGRLYVSFGEPAASRPVEDVLADLLTAVGHRRTDLPEGRAERARLLRAWTAGRRVLLVVDDVTASHQITDLLPADVGSALLVVGLRRLASSQIRTRVDIGPLRAEDAADLCLTTLGRGLQPADEPGLWMLLDLCDHLPGPVIEAVNLLALRPHWTVWRLIDWMKRERQRTAPAQRTHPCDHLVRRSGCLAPALREVLAKLAAGSQMVVTVEKVASALGRSTIEAEEELEELVELFLLNVELSVDGPPTEAFFRYRIPQLLRTALQVTPVYA
ncbi:BTAD domain-containing putative transcriptional regulator [Streptomyces sp. NPDC056987]|uniref:AfsR/SARP family transcriptional regulator n=1 Tax=Streptomyces sp. NPDC056987 TaxID=3345988 RepID=UPI003644C9DE